jgi:hypothetical protein
MAPLVFLSGKPHTFCTFLAPHIVGFFYISETPVSPKWGPSPVFHYVRTVVSILVLLLYPDDGRSTLLEMSARFQYSCQMIISLLPDLRNCRLCRLRTAWPGFDSCDEQELPLLYSVQTGSGDPFPWVN